MKTKAKALKVGVLIDLVACMGKTPEQEYDEHVKDFSALLRPAKCSFYRMMNEGEIKPGTDAVVFDYGGMCGVGSDGFISSVSRVLIKWAEDNPSSLLIVATAFTYSHAVRYELDELGLNLPNVVCRASINEDPIPFWFRTKSEPILKAKPDPFEGPRNLHPIAGLTPLNHNNPLPFMQFFKPMQGFVEWFKASFGRETVYDAGAGTGHVAKALADANACYKVEAIDANARMGSVFKVQIKDATEYRFMSDSVVLICRPCHDEFCQAVVQNALFHRASAVVYVGLDKNVKKDLGDYAGYFSREKAGVGEGGECAWVWRPDWNKQEEERVACKQENKQ